MPAVASHDKTIRIPTNLRAEVVVRQDTFNAEDRTVEVCWSTGAKVKRYSWDEGYYMEELLVDKKAIRLDRFEAMSFLDTHEVWSMDSRLGTVVPGTVRIEGGKAYARLKLSRKQRGEELFQDLQDGMPLPISVGYKIHRYEKTEGADGQLPVLRAVDWEPIEISAVPVPADPGATSISRSEPQGSDFDTVLVRQDESISAAAAASHKDKTMNKRDAAKKFSGAELDALALGAGMTRKDGEADDALRIRLLAAYDAEDASAARAAEEETRRAAEETQRREEEARRAQQQPVPPANAPAGLTAAQVDEQMARSLEQEYARTTEITTIATRAGMDLNSETVRNALKPRGSTVDAFRAVALDHMVTEQGRSPTFPHIETRGGQDAQETMRRMITNALLHQRGLTDKLEDGAREWRTMGALEIARELLNARGESTRGGIHAVASRAMHSTSDFPLILQSVVRATLLNAYAVYPNTFENFSTLEILPDYRDTKLLDVGSAPDLKLKNEHGEFLAGTFRESEESMKLQRYGRRIGFTHEMLVNDQLGQFLKLVSQWGNKVAKLEGDVMWGAIINNMVLHDGTALFAPSRNNLASAGTAMDLANLKKARKAMRAQKDIDGEIIHLEPKFLYTGANLELDAQTLVAAPYNPAVLAEVTPQAIKSLVPVYEPRLNLITNNAWFLFADPLSSNGRGIHHLRLQGYEQPTTNEEIQFSTEGVHYSIAHSFGVGLTDFRWAYKNPGVAPS